MILGIDEMSIFTMMSIFGGVLMGIAVYRSIKDFFKMKKLWQLSPAIMVFLFIAVMAIKYNELLAPISMAGSFLVMHLKQRGKYGTNH